MALHSFMIFYVSIGQVHSRESLRAHHVDLTLMSANWNLVTRRAARHLRLGRAGAV
jgi:hypothetical protein